MPRWNTLHKLDPPFSWRDFTFQAENEPKERTNIIVANVHHDTFIEPDTDNILRLFYCPPINMTSNLQLLS